MNTTSSMTVSLGIPSDPAAIAGVRELERQRLRGLLRQRLFGQPAAPARIGRFQIVRKLGEGAAGVVYAAFDPRMERQVALKVLMTQVEGRRALIREARALAQLSHPNVLTVYEVNDESDLAYIASELVEEGSLREWLREPHSPSQRLDMLLGVGRGIVSAHRAGLVHRDLKPENVLVGDGRPRIADFGLARVWAAEQGTLSGGAGVVGTHGYMAPEQRRGEAPTPKNDQYSFGVMAYEVLFERHPFLLPTSPGGELQRLRFDPAAPIAPPAPSHPCAAIWPVIERALRSEPAARWPDMQELLGALEATPSRRAEPNPRTRKSWMLPLAAVASLMTLALGVVAFRPWARSETSGTQPSSTADGPDNARDVELYLAVRPMMDRMDWVGCSRYLAQHANTETSRATWVTCAEASRDAELLQQACASASQDPSPPDSCEPAIVLARALHRAGRFHECVKRLCETEPTNRRFMQLSECAQSLQEDRVVSTLTCMYGTRIRQGHASPADCGLPSGMQIGTGGQLMPLDVFLVDIAVSRPRPECEKVAREHGGGPLLGVCQGR